MTRETTGSQEAIPEDMVNPCLTCLAVSRGGKDMRFIDVAGTVPGRLHRLPRPVIDPVIQVLSMFILGAGPPLSCSALGLQHS